MEAIQGGVFLLVMIVGARQLVRKIASHPEKAGQAASFLWGLFRKR